MRTQLTKSFRFSACHEHDGKVYGHNYVLRITAEEVPPERDREWEQRIYEALIAPMHSKDLGKDVPCLRGLEITDERLLEVFYQTFRASVPWGTVISMTLDRDDTTATHLLI